MESWVDEVILKWKNEGVKINTGVSIEEIIKAETLLDFKFPDDFKEFYSKINGFKDLDWQEHMFYFWPLERIIEDFDNYDKKYVCFCDFLLASHYIGFRKDKSGIYKAYYEVDVDPISHSFKEVVRMINSNSDLVY